MFQRICPIPSPSRFSFSRPVRTLCALALGLSPLAVGLQARAQTAPATAPVTPVAPVVSPVGATYAQPTQVTITDATPGTVIYYLVNGGAPIKYSGPFTVTVSESLQTVAVIIGKSSYTVSPIVSESYTIQNLPAPSWTRLTNLPSVFGTAGGGVIVNAGDANLYALTYTGAPPNNVISVYVASQANLSYWYNITSPSLSSNGTEIPNTMGVTPNGTVFLSETNKSSVSDVYYWNGSLAAPAWKKVTGYNGVSSSSIYNFTNDSAGYTYFSPAYSGDIWRNDAPNSTNFTKIYANLYSILGAGNYGGLFQTFVWNLNDGNGDMLWACGEGSLLNVNLAFTQVTQYLNGPNNSGNCFGLGKSASNILALRNADTNGDSLNRISIATRATTVIPGADPLVAPYYPSYMNSNFVNSLLWVNGTKWMLNNSVHSLYSMLLSQDDGSTWTDITQSGGIDSTCTGANLDGGAAVTNHYIITRCQNGKVYWVYGPI